MNDLLHPPPIRTPLQDANAPGSGTVKEWYYYFANAGDQINANRQAIADLTGVVDRLIDLGPHASRPGPTAMPEEGALYYETDRGAIYQAINNHGVTYWQYIAGTMYGTLSPDQRPTDLGNLDAGFDFRGTDEAREFIWSQTAWVEVTPARYGTHAARLAATPASFAAGVLWVETDRNNVVYQVQKVAGTPAWIYVAGVMSGTFSPDQRPAGLGTNDTGFRFFATDQSRDYVWLGGAWASTASQTPWTSDIDAAGHHLLNTGYVGIGTATPGASLDVSGNAIVRGEVQVGGAAKSAVSVATCRLRSSDATNQLEGWFLLFGGANPRVGISCVEQGIAFRNVTLCENAGNVGIGVANPSFQLQLSADSAGKPATSTWSVVSDVRAKQNVEPMNDDSLGILAALEWVRYEYNGEAGTLRGQKAVGLTAQQAQRHLPEAVREIDGEEELLGIDYHHIIVHSARAIQQLEKEVKELKARLRQP